VPVEDTLGSPNGDSATVDPQRFLTNKRIEDIGRLVAPLIRDDLSWLERRKEKVEVLDDSTLQRHVSVDFSLRGATEPLLANGSGDSLYCAPVYVLPKAPANLMSFHLRDESGQALTLINRQDNAQISAAALKTMAATVLETAKRDLPVGLAREITRITGAEAEKGQELAARLVSKHPPAWKDELAILGKDDRFRWWLQTLAHSSLVVVLFRAPSPRRKLVKLSFEQPIATKQRWQTLLGWLPYQVGVDSSLIEARSFHFEAHSPPGLRISKASLSDDSGDDPIAEAGFLRRVHLYKSDARTAGAGTAVLWLTVGGPGFVSGALSATALTTVALTTCLFAAGEIAANSTSAPALLLALPALIASYVARPDQHALTTKMLAAVRWLLLSSALLAYAAAAWVTFTGHGSSAQAAVDERTGDLQLGLGIAAALSLIPLTSIAITWIRNRRQALGQLTLDGHCFDSCFVAAGARDTYTYLTPPHEFADYELVDHNKQENQLVYLRDHWHGTWIVTICAKDDEGFGCTLSAASAYVSKLRGVRGITPLFSRRQDAAIATVLESVREWARTGAEFSPLDDSEQAS
jgi:hypothetical protein